PFTSKKLFTMLNLQKNDWTDAGKTGILAEGHQLGTVQLLFEKITDEQVQFQLDKLADAKLANQLAGQKAVPAKSNISFEDFSAMDIRTGKIIEAEKVAKT